MYFTKIIISLLACVAGSPDGYQNPLELFVVCHMLSGEGGIFSFGSVAPGTYILTPYFHSSITKYEVTPAQLEVTVLHDDLILQQPFKVS